MFHCSRIFNLICEYLMCILKNTIHLILHSEIHPVIFTSTKINGKPLNFYFIASSRRFLKEIAYFKRLNSEEILVSWCKTISNLLSTCGVIFVLWPFVSWAMRAVRTKEPKKLHFPDQNFGFSIYNLCPEYFMTMSICQLSSCSVRLWRELFCSLGWENIHKA